MPWPDDNVCPECGHEKLTKGVLGHVFCSDLDCDYKLPKRCAECPGLPDCDMSGAGSCCFGKWREGDCGLTHIDDSHCSVHEACELVTGAGKGAVAVRSEL